MDVRKIICGGDGLSLLEINNNDFEKAFLEIVREQIGEESLFWTSNSTKVDRNATWFKLHQNSLESMTVSSSNQKLFTYCASSRQKSSLQKNECKRENFYNGSNFSMEICYTTTAASYYETLKSCEANNMTLLTVENSAVKEAFTAYHQKSFGPHGILWINGVEKNKNWYTDNKTFLIDAMQPKAVVLGASCLAFLGSESSSQKCSASFWGYCGKKTSKKSNRVLCNRKSDLLSSKVYIKSVCEVLKPTNFDDGNSMCRNEGMELFVIDSSETQEAFSKFVRRDSTEAFWINGRRTGFDPWFSYNPEQQTIFPGKNSMKKRSKIL
jgi:hypothetical protein